EVVDEDAPGRGLQQPDAQPQQRRLARPVGAHDRGGAGLEGHVDVVQGGAVRVVAEGDALEADAGHDGATSSSAVTGQLPSGRRQPRARAAAVAVGSATPRPTRASPPNTSAGVPSAMTRPASSATTRVAEAASQSTS